MSQNPIEFEKKLRKPKFMISKHLFIFDDNKTIYKSNKTVKSILESKGDGASMISYEKDFSKVNV